MRSANIIPVKRVVFVTTRWGHGVICAIERHFNVVDQKWIRWYGVRHLDNEDVFTWLDEKIGYMGRITFQVVDKDSGLYEQLRIVLEEMTDGVT